MKRNLKTLVIKNKEDLKKVDRYVEKLCEFNNITDEYFGTIQLAVSEATGIIALLGDHYGVSSFEIDCRRTDRALEFVFQMNSQAEAFLGDESDMDREIRRYRLSEQHYIMKTLADGFSINDRGDGFTVRFNINGINPGRAISRSEQLRIFLSRQKSSIAAENASH